MEKINYSDVKFLHILSREFGILKRILFLGSIICELNSNWNFIPMRNHSGDRIFRFIKKEHKLIINIIRFVPLEYYRNVKKLNFETIPNQCIFYLKYFSMYSGICETTTDHLFSRITVNNFGI